MVERLFNTLQLDLHSEISAELFPTCIITNFQNNISIGKSKKGGNICQMSHAVESQQMVFSSYSGLRIKTYPAFYKRKKGGLNEAKMLI
jgi:hypothetical protein